MVMGHRWGRRQASYKRAEAVMCDDECELKPPPVGVMPHDLWWEQVGADPSLSELLNRHQTVNEACIRSWDAGYRPRLEWLMELGVL